MNAMPKLVAVSVLLSSALILQACQTTKPLAKVDKETICLALSRSDSLPTLTDAEKALIREKFSRTTKDRLKTPQAIMQAIGCLK